MVNYDFIFDMFICICNVSEKCYEIIKIFVLWMICSIVKVLQQEGFIFEISEQGEGVCIELVFVFKYSGKYRLFIICFMQWVSKFGFCIYKNICGLFKVFGGLGVVIIFIFKGVMSDCDVCCEGVGGEVFCYVY